jgi:hypothetical protein|tara:strand:+ start:5100 stop:6998 length:1899 start_codon:yes stop_codon:yes gene_type:complete
MSVDTTTRKVTYTLSPITDFPFTFRALTSTPTDIKCKLTVIATGVISDLTYTTDYTVAVNSNGIGGTVTLVTTYGTTHKLTIYRDTTDNQESDYNNYNNFPADTLETDLDKRTIKSQELSEDLDRSLKVDVASTITTITIPEPSTGKALIWSSNTIVNSTTNVDDSEVAAASSATAALASQVAAAASEAAALISANTASTQAISASTSATTATSQATISVTQATLAGNYATTASTAAATIPTMPSGGTSGLIIAVKGSEDGYELSALQSVLTGANLALSNLASVAIQTDLSPATTAVINLGTSALKFATMNVTAITTTTIVVGSADASLAVFTDAAKKLETKSAADARTALSIGTAGLLNTPIADSSLAQITTASKVDTSALTGTTYLPDETVDTTALKTATSSGSLKNNTGSWVYSVQTPGGGEYGFYPQARAVQDAPDGGTTVANVTLMIGKYDAAIVTASAGVGGGGDDSGYLTKITLGVMRSGSVTGNPDCYGYWQQRYVTSSGMDEWIFLLIDKSTKEIISGWQAPDHPSYGNGGDVDALPHPFTSYDEAKNEIILVDKVTCNALIKEHKKTRKSILTIVSESYKLDYNTERKYIPLHTGKFLGEVPVMVKSIPSYIKVRKLDKIIV